MKGKKDYILGVKLLQSKNYKILIIGVAIGILISSTVAYAQAVLGASSVSYNNSSSKLSSTTVQGAIDEIYNTATGGDIVYNNKNIIGAYMYDDVSCKTGEENTCKKTACPNDKSRNSCPSGTIVKYKVNDSTTKIFHVLHDDISALTLQQNENTVASTVWYLGENDNSKGPLTALEALESATSGWSNVNTINYTMGTTAFNGINSYTGCDLSGNNWNCTENKYTLGARSSKARMITGQETSATGCTFADNSCPKWMTTGGHYWSASSNSSDSNRALYVDTNRYTLFSYYTSSSLGARAVVVISK